ncbi:hypothetical protein CISG_05752 [Coccidioides immitis RMSCC 3703]|uniref:Uncharacterized protein n=1 Tax=Coccidioides immitis RMSCC 3703 TaxID=454286 RepID=A0A0J8QUS1_COCIT|nr:hypothetical protein CISG_05752 [Coccidioides immitis RMSCC 3703]
MRDKVNPRPWSSSSVAFTQQKKKLRRGIRSSIAGTNQHRDPLHKVAAVPREIQAWHYVTGPLGNRSLSMTNRARDQPRQHELTTGDRELDDKKARSIYMPACICSKSTTRNYDVKHEARRIENLLLAQPSGQAVSNRYAIT